MEQTKRRQEKLYCSRIGFSLALTIGCSFLWQIVVAAAGYAGLLPQSQTVYYLLALVGYYLAALPLAILVCRRVPVPQMDGRGLRPHLLGRWFVIGVSLMWLGSLAGSWVNSLVYRIAGLQPVDRVSESLGMLPVAVTLLGACVLGPLCEELLFRGLIARRLARYGQRPAALVSALLFALYHANLSQFFYALALGLLLAYAYFYTGSFVAPVVLHMLFNFYGAFIALLLPADSRLIVLYALSWPALTIVGAALLVCGWKKQAWARGICAPTISVIFCNAGMTTAIVICFVESALLLF